MSRPNQNNWRVPTLLIALVICGVLSVVHRQSERAQRRDPISGVVRDAALVSPLTMTEKMGHWWQIHVLSLFNAPHLAQQNTTVMAENLNLKAEIKQIQAAQIENDRLRSLLAFEKKSPRPLLAAEVVALKPSTQIDTLTLNRGSGQGVHPSSVVVAPDGSLVGQVILVTRNTCDVLLLTDSTSSVGTQVDGPGSKPPIGICHGDPAGHLHLTYLSIDAPVAVGGSVSTSGLGGVFPKGIPVGTVISVSSDQDLSMKNAQVRPAADFDHLVQAFVIR